LKNKRPLPVPGNGRKTLFHFAFNEQFEAFGPVRAVRLFPPQAKTGSCGALEIPHTQLKPVTFRIN